MVYFSSEIFRSAGLSSEAAASAAVGLTNVVGTALASRMLDSAGRKPLLLARGLTRPNPEPTKAEAKAEPEPKPEPDLEPEPRPALQGSFAGMAASAALLAAALALPALRQVAGPLALGGTLAYVAAFSLGAGPVPALIVSELIPARLRGKAQSAAMGVHWRESARLARLRGFFGGGGGSPC